MQQTCTAIILKSTNESGKYFYETLNDQYKNLSLRNKWNNVLNTTINDDEWNKIFRNCFKTVCRNDLILLQFHIIHRIVGTRSHLQKININNCTFCDFCQSSSETIYHLFAACPVVIEFWRNVRQWLQSLGIYINLTPITLIWCLRK